MGRAARESDLLSCWGTSFFFLTSPVITLDPSLPDLLSGSEPRGQLSVGAAGTSCLLRNLSGTAGAGRRLRQAR